MKRSSILFLMGLAMQFGQIIKNNGGYFALFSLVTTVAVGIGAFVVMQNDLADAKDRIKSLERKIGDISESLAGIRNNPDLKGAKGDRGEKGEKGDAGPKGDSGDVVFVEKTEGTNLIDDCVLTAKKGDLWHNYKFGVNSIEPIYDFSRRLVSHVARFAVVTQSGEQMTMTCTKYIDGGPPSIYWGKIR